MKKNKVVERFSKHICVLYYCLEKGFLCDYCELPFIENSYFVIEDILLDLLEVVDRESLDLTVEDFNYYEFNSIDFLNITYKDSLFIKNYIENTDLETLPFLRNNIGYLDDIILDVIEAQESMKLNNKIKDKVISKHKGKVIRMVERELIGNNCIELALNKIA